VTDLVCIACPIGCRLSVTTEGGGLSVSGNRCPKGETYGKEEATSPKRVVTAVVRTDNPDFPYIPVRTDKALPRSLTGALLLELSRREVRLPAARGNVLIEDYDSTGVRVILTRTLPPDDIAPVG
jgi:CxxC motif-containing protein